MGGKTRDTLQSTRNEKSDPNTRPSDLQHRRHKKKTHESRERQTNDNRERQMHRERCETILVSGRHSSSTKTTQSTRREWVRWQRRPKRTMYKTTTHEECNFFHQEQSCSTYGHWLSCCGFAGGVATDIGPRCTFVLCVMTDESDKRLESTNKRLFVVVPSHRTYLWVME